MTRPSNLRAFLAGECAPTPGAPHFLDRTRPLPEVSHDGPFTSVWHDIDDVAMWAIDVLDDGTAITWNVWAP